MAELEGVVKTECDDPGHYVDGALDFWDGIKLGNSSAKVSTSPRDSV